MSSPISNSLGISTSSLPLPNHFFARGENGDTRLHTMLTDHPINFAKIIDYINQSPSEALSIKDRMDRAPLFYALDLSCYDATFNKDALQSKIVEVIRSLIEKLSLNAVSMEELDKAVLNCHIPPHIIEVMVKKLNPEDIKNKHCYTIKDIFKLNFERFKVLIQTLPREVVLRQDEQGSTTLHHSITRIRDYAFDSSILDPSTKNPFDLLVQILCPEDFSITNMYHNTALHLIMKIYNCSENRTCYSGIISIKYLSEDQAKNIDYFAMALIEKSSINALSVKNAKGETPLFLAIQAKRLKLAEALISKLSPEALLLDPEALNLARSTRMNDIAISIEEKTINDITKLPEELARLAAGLQ